MTRTRRDGIELLTTPSCCQRRRNPCLPEFGVVRRLDGRLGDAAVVTLLRIAIGPAALTFLGYGPDPSPRGEVTNMHTASSREESRQVTSGALATVLSKQRRPLLVAVLLSVAVAWVAVPTGRPALAVFFAAGALLSLLNHVLTEVALFRSLNSETEVSRNSFIAGAIGRLALVTVIAMVLVVTFWPNGAAVLIGLAVMHLVMIVFTGLPLLSEIRKA
jgi:hypothetical protein